MSEVWPCPKCRGTLSQSCDPCGGTGRVHVFSPAQNEALMAAIKELADLHRRCEVIREKEERRTGVDS